MRVGLDSTETAQARCECWVARIHVDHTSYDLSVHNQTLWYGLYLPAGFVSLNCGGGFTVGPGAGGAWRGAEGAGALAVTLLGGARVGYLRAAAPAAPAAFEEELPIVGLRGLSVWAGVVGC